MTHEKHRTFSHCEEAVIVQLYMLVQLTARGGKNYVQNSNSEVMLNCCVNIFVKLYEPERVS